MNGKRPFARALWTIFLGLAVSATADAAAIYTSRTAFNAAIGASITDTYSEAVYGSSPGGLLIFNDIQMNAFFGETRYIPTGFPNINLIMYSPPFGLPWPGTYCAGCNGSFILDFAHTTIGSAEGVFGVGFDYFNTGNPLFGDPSYDAFITFGDNSTLDVPLNSTFNDFFGVTSNSLISSIALGLPNGGVTTRGSFGESNLTIAAAPVPEPSSIVLLCTLIGVGAIFAAGRRPQQSKCVSAGGTINLHG